MICGICGKHFDTPVYSQNSDFGDCCSSDCFNIRFWKLIIAEKDKYLIVNHQSWCDGGYIPGPKKWKGCAGRIFRYHRFDEPDNLVHTTDNMWHQGTVPEQFWDELPDNAEFLNIF